MTLPRGRSPDYAQKKTGHVIELDRPDALRQRQHFSPDNGSKHYLNTDFISKGAECVLDTVAGILELRGIKATDGARIGNAARPTL